MERLTEKRNGNNVIPLKADHAWALTHGRGGHQYLSGEAADRLAAYEATEENGLLVRLPCKVGDTVYFITDKVNKAKILGFEMYNGKGWQIVLSTSSFIAATVQPCSIAEFGKTVFLTRTEAEAALAEVEK